MRSISQRETGITTNRPMGDSAAALLPLLALSVREVDAVLGETFAIRSMTAQMLQMVVAAQS